MSRRSKHRGSVKAVLEECHKEKGRKKPWMPRGGNLIPPGKTHKPKNTYKRQREDWRNWIYLEKEEE